MNVKRNPRIKLKIKLKIFSLFIIKSSLKRLKIEVSFQLLNQKYQREKLPPIDIFFNLFITYLMNAIF